MINTLSDITARFFSRLTAQKRQINTPAVFIIGTGRCGSTLLQKMLDTHHEIFVYPETHWIPHLYHQFGSSRQRLITFLDVVARTKHVNGAPTTAIDTKLTVAAQTEKRLYSVREFCDFFGNWHASKHQKLRWADKTPDYGSHLFELSQIWPNLKIVHLIRDGTDVAKSMALHPGFQAMVHNHSVNWVPLSLDWIPEPFEPSIRPLDYINLWQKSLSNLLHERRHIAESCWLEIRFEDLIDKPKDVLSRICSFAELSVNEPWLLKTSEMIDRNRFSNRSNEYRDYFDEEQRLLLKATGYL